MSRKLEQCGFGRHNRTPLLGQRKAIFQQQTQNQLRVLAIRLLLAYPLASDLRRISHSLLKGQFRQHSLKPARVSTGFHPHAHLYSLRREIAIELLRFLAMP